MKRLKSISFLLIAIFLVFTSGCSGKSNNEKDEGKDGKIKLTFWDFHVDEEKAFFEEAVKDYNKMQDKVEIELLSVNQSDYTTTLLPTAFANSEGPDIFFVEPSVFLKYAEAGTLADLTDYISDDVRSDFKQSALDAVSYHDKILSIPFEQELLALFYNKKMLEEANVAVPETWEELYDAAKKLNNNVAGIVLPTDKIPYTNFNFYPFLFQTGGQVISEDGTKSQFNSPEVVQALDFWGSFFKDGLAPNKLQLGPWDIGNVGTGFAAMQIMGTYGVNDAEEKYGDVEIGVAPLPHPEGKESVTVAGGQSLAVNAKSKHLKEAIDFATWLFASDDISYCSKWVTEAKFAYPPRQSVVEANKEFFSEGLRKVFTDEIYDSAIPEPRLPSNVSDIVGDALQQVMYTDKIGEAVVEKADKEINDALNK